MSTKKTLVTFACASALFSIVNTPSTFADDVTVEPSTAVAPTKPSVSEVPSADTVDTGKAETPAVPEVPAVPSTEKEDKGKTETPAVPEVPAVPSTEKEDKGTTEAPSTKAPTTSSTTEKPSTTEDKKDDKKPEEDKKDNTHLPIVDPTVPDTKPIETNKGTVTGTDNGKVIIKDASTGEERKVAPEELGGKVEKDGTVTIKEKDGKLTRLPNTGVEESIPMVVSGMTMLTSGFGFLKRPRKKA